MYCRILHGSGALALESGTERMEFGNRGMVVISNCSRHQDSWINGFVGLHKPLAKLLVDDVEGSNRMMDDDLHEAFDVQATRMQNNH